MEKRKLSSPKCFQKGNGSELVGGAHKSQDPRRRYQMSRKKIKADKPKIRKPKFTPEMIRKMMGLDDERTQRRQKDADKVTDLIINGTLDPYMIHDYKHVKSAARTLDWSAHRMFKAIEFAKVAEMVKNEQELENGDKPKNKVSESI
jgi:hypothetical protein